MDTILVERRDGVVRATLNRPEKKNALNMAMVDDLAGLLEEVRNRTDDRVLILTGAGGAFCSGADLTDRDSVQNLTGAGAWLDRMRQIHAIPLAIHDLPKPVIAAVPGVAAGAGCNLALACDLVVASDEARFCEIFVRRGIGLDCGGSWLLPRLVGLQRAKELAFFGDMVDAGRAEAIGLVNRVVPGAELEAVVEGMAGRLAAGPPVALAAIKQSLHHAVTVPMAESLDVEGLHQTICMSTADAAEAMRAFVERREPRFEGR